MNFFETVEKRRSIRQFTKDPVPSDVIRKAIDAALLAPNSSNVQTWDFYWFRSPEKKAALVKACMNQAAARTAQELIVVTADPKLWKRSHGSILKFIEEVKAPKLVHEYYRKLIPLTYSWGPFQILTPLKWIIINLIGLFRPIGRTPVSKRDAQEVAIKSAALACENLVLAITAQGYASCMMEGFDECRVKRLLPLPFSRRFSTRVVMVIGIGKESDRGTWGPRFRIDKEQVIHEI
jgi:nitroreductase